MNTWSITNLGNFGGKVILVGEIGIETVNAGLNLITAIAVGYASSQLRRLREDLASIERKAVERRDREGLN